MHPQERNGNSRDHEDRYASDGMPGLANFLPSLLEPLEAQGRGSAHGHKKCTGAPAANASSMKEMFNHTEAELMSLLVTMREKVVEAAATIQYDSVDVSAVQLGVAVTPAPFSKK